MKPTKLLTLLLTVFFLLLPIHAVEASDNDHSHSTQAHHEDHNDTEHDHHSHEQHQPHHDDESEHEEHDHNSDHEHEHEEEQTSHIDEEMASQVGINTEYAQPQMIHQSVIVYGSLTTGPKQLSHVRARYSGLIKSVQPTIGDRVKYGDLLAEVESNESLRTYKILAPITGTIIQRHANTGEVTLDQILFSIANFDTLWAELRIYPAQQAAVKPGQEVHIDVDEWRFTGPIQHVIPALDKPYQLARVKFDNSEKGLSPGMLVEGHIVVSKFLADLAVTRTAIQTMGEHQGVFVKKGDQYEFTPLQLGRNDDLYIEVLSGLDPQQRYVSKNSYLIKADIEKSAAEHHH